MTHVKGHDAAGRKADPEHWAILDAEARVKKTAATGQPTVSGDLNSFLSGLGIASPGLGTPGGRNPFFGAPESDYPVLVRRNPARRSAWGPFGKAPRVALQSQLLRDLYRMEPADLITLQQRLLAGGFYSGDVEAEDVAFGTHDEDTLKAYERAITRAAAFNEAEADVTLDEVIDKAIGANAGKDKGGPKKDPLVIQLSDPEDVRRGVEAVARKAIGRKLSDAEREKFVGLWHAVQSQTQRAAYGAAETGGTVTSAPGFEAFAAARIAKEYGVEAGAHDLAEQGNEFMQLLNEVGG